MKRIHIFLILILFNTNLFSQLIIDQYVFPIPRIVDSTYMVVTSSFGNYVLKADSFNIKKDTGMFYDSIVINSYYNHSAWAAPNIITDTINLSQFINKVGSYKIIYYLNYTFDTPESSEKKDSSIFHIDAISNNTEIVLKNKNLNIYPNPINTNSTIYSSDIITYIEIYDIRGFLLIRKNINKELYKLNLNNYKKGMYFIKIRTKKSIITKKIIVE